MACCSSIDHHYPHEANRQAMPSGLTPRRRHRFISYTPGRSAAVGSPTLRFVRHDNRRLPYTINALKQNAIRKKISNFAVNRIHTLTMNTDNRSTRTAKTGLVLEGGAMRGLFSAGVIDVMMEHELWPDGVVGVSAGAAFGCNMKSRQIGRSIRYNKRFARDWRYCSVRSYLKTGELFGGDFCYHELPTTLDPFDTKTYGSNDMNFYAVCTDVDTGLPVYKKIDEMNFESMEWIRASASMPVAAKIVRINGRKLLDGGISDSIPLRFFQNMGYTRNIVVLTQPRDFIKQPEKIAPLIRMLLRKHPEFVAASDRRHVMYNDELDYIRQEEAAGRILVLAPDEKLPVNHVCHDPRLMQQTYELGRQAAERAIDNIKLMMA